MLVTLEISLFFKSIKYFSCLITSFSSKTPLIIFNTSCTFSFSVSFGNTTFIFSTQNIETNSQTNAYSFRTNSGEQVEVPIKSIDEETGQESIATSLGFSPILQSYVFRVNEDNETLFSFYSKRNAQEEVQYKSTLPVYNKESQQFAELTNDNDVGCLLVISGLDNNFRFKEKLLANFVNFKIVPNTLYWINEKSVIVEAVHTNQTDNPSKSEYLLIEFNL